MISGKVAVAVRLVRLRRGQEARTGLEDTWDSEHDPRMPYSDKPRGRHTNVVKVKTNKLL